MTIDKKFYNLGDIAVCFITVDGVTETVFVPADMTDRLNDEKLAGISPLGWMISPETQVHIALSGDGISNDFSPGNTLRNSDTAFSLKFKGAKYEEQSGKQILIAAFENDKGLVARQVYSCTGAGYLETYTELENRGDNVIVEALPSFNMARISPFERFDDPNDIVIHRLLSNWSGEGKLYSVSAADIAFEASWSGLGVRTMRISQTGTMPARGYLPFISVEDKKNGVCWAAETEAPASWTIEAVFRNNAISVGGGRGDFLSAHWRKTLKTGETEKTNKAYLTVTKGSLENAAARLARHFDDTDEIKDVERDLPVLYNEYCYTWGKPEAKTLEKMLPEIAALGCKYFVIDDGWFYNVYNDKRYVIGDWNVNKEYYPEGLKAFADKVRSYGMIPGVWYEFEGVSEHSDVYRDHPDWLLTRDGKIINNGGRAFLDFRKEEVLNYLREKVIKNLVNCGIGYMKVDYNSNAGFGADGAESYGEAIRQHIDAVLAFFEEIKRSVPSLVLEICSSGGMRHEPRFLSLGDMCSFSDAHENAGGVPVAMNLHRFIPPRKLQIWATIRDDNNADDVKFTVAKAMLGRICFSGNLGNKPQEIIDILKESVSFYEKLKPTIANGDTITIENGGISTYLFTKGSPYLVRRSADGKKKIVYAFAIDSENHDFSIDCGDYSVLDTFNAPENTHIADGKLLFTSGKEKNFGCVILLQKNN
ncbi:MAG TPA: hypothetical protein DCE65_04065 [Clostridiales bacterium]|nr:hypothetical protein [Clostridiales bacterium]